MVAGAQKTAAALGLDHLTYFPLTCVKRSSVIRTPVDLVIAVFLFNYMDSAMSRILPGCGPC